MDMRGQLKLGQGRLTSKDPTGSSQTSPTANQCSGASDESVLVLWLFGLRIPKFQIILTAIAVLCV